ncbi:DUF1206 domain-containing protein [Yoonia sp. 208BN28-4]|uniref:DUF1206 domain-containing protein n=1 Tax=Yoonia sp. 208BN28-4 TaxID=3126505 RepID=UPI00309C0689
MPDRKMNWAMPVMRAGYAGRGLTYLAISGLSLWTIWQGGDAQGTSEALKSLETSFGGQFALYIIAIGLLAYMGWRVLDGIADLEDYGRDGKGLIARGGMVVTGLLHGVIGIAAFAITATSSDGEGGPSRIQQATRMVMEMPLGVWAVGAAGAITVGAGIYYLRKAWTQSYRDKLEGNHFTTHWSPALQAGVAAQGLTVGTIGAFLLFAAVRHDPSQAGGLGEMFSWLSGEPYGRILVTLLCIGLLGFALFLFVNARYRIVDKLSDPDITTLSAKLG